jgi:Putative peptidoglycan binding domain
MTAATRPKLRWFLLVALSIAATATGAETIARWAGTAVEPTIDASPVLETVTVTVGDLTSTERIDGTIEETQSITVLHRIEGQSSASTPTQPSTQDSPTDASAASNVSPVGLASFASSVNATQADTVSVDAAPEPECPPVDEPTTTTTATAPGVTIPVDDECDPTTTPDTTPHTTTPDTTTPDTTPPDTTPPDTTPPDTTATTIPTAGSGAEPTGDSGRVGSIPGGVGGPSSRQGTTSGGTTTSSELSTQMITSIAAIGSPIANGDVIYTVDGQPVVALHGTQPAWRTLESGVDDGPDVLQLEQSLVDLGYDPDGTVTIDDTFDSDTKAAIKRWQEGLAADPTGAVELGSVVFIAADTSVTAHLAAVGDDVTDGTAIVTLSGSSHHVVIEVPTELQTIVAPGLAVDISGTAGVVTVLRSAERDSTTVVQALITPIEPLDDRTGTVVTVRIDVTGAIGAMIVPAEALVSRLDGTYAVQVGSPDGPHEFLPVTVLAVSGGDVAVQSDQLGEGMTVLVPV